LLLALFRSAVGGWKNSEGVWRVAIMRHKTTTKQHKGLSLSLSLSLSHTHTTLSLSTYPP